MACEESNGDILIYPRMFSKKACSIYLQLLQTIIQQLKVMEKHTIGRSEKGRY